MMPPEQMPVYRACNRVKRVLRKHRANPLEPDSAIEQSRRLVAAALESLDKAWELLAFDEWEKRDE